jgi:hypothetical protein
VDAAEAVAESSSLADDATVGVQVKPNRSKSADATTAAPMHTGPTRKRTAAR